MNWKDLSIKQVKDINHISSNKDLKQEEKTVKIISIVYNLDENEVWNLSLPDINKKADECKFLSIDPKYKANKIDKVLINGIQYNAVYDFSKFTYSQYVDFQVYMNQASTTENIAEVLSTILVPNGMQYNQGYDMIKVQNEINNYLDIETANSILGFFFKQLKISITQYLALLEKQMKRNKNLNKEQKEAIKEIIQNTQSIIG